MNKTLTRFLKYTAIGLPTFFFDLFLLYIFIDVLFIHYITATIVAYLIALSINYYYSRKHVFHQTKRRMDHGYYNFLIIGMAGLIFVSTSMFILVDVLQQDYFISRTFIALLVGVSNYIINLYFNFKVAGKH